MCLFSGFRTCLSYRLFWLYDVRYVLYDAFYAIYFVLLFISVFPRKRKIFAFCCCYLYSQLCKFCQHSSSVHINLSYIIRLSSVCGCRCRRGCHQHCSLLVESNEGKKYLTAICAHSHVCGCVCVLGHLTREHMSAHTVRYSH